MPAAKRTTAASTALSVESIERRIHMIRGQKMMLDTDLALVYRVPTSRLNEAAKRNRKRFPEDFMFQLTAAERQSLRSQNAISNPTRGGRRTLPYVFTKHGVAMISSVLNNERAIAMNILIVRALIKPREVLATQKELAVRVDKLESHHRRHASVMNILADEIEQIKSNPSPRKRPIGFSAAQAR